MGFLVCTVSTIVNTSRKYMKCDPVLLSDGCTFHIISTRSEQDLCFTLRLISNHNAATFSSHKTTMKKTEKSIRVLSTINDKSNNHTADASDEILALVKDAMEYVNKEIYIDRLFTKNITASRSESFLPPSRNNSKPAAGAAHRSMHCEIKEKIQKMI